jgi:hypothetical protein
VATVALAGCDQFAAAVGLADVQDFDFFADDRARAWEAAVLVKRCLSGGELFVFVVAVDGDVLDQAVELGGGVAGWADRISLRSGGWVEAFQQQRWALADLAAAEPADRLVHADGGGVLVELHHDAFDATQVLGRVRWLKRTRSPTLSIASALAQLTVSSRSRRAWIASAIAVRCWSSSPWAIWSRSSRSAGGPAGAVAAACGWEGW